MSKLSQCVEILDHKRIPLSAKQRESLAKVYPYYGAQGIIDYVDDYIFDGEYILVAEDGNNLKSLNENISTWATGKFWVNNHAHILGEKEGYNLKYIYYLLNCMDLRGYITGSAQPKLNQENLANIEIHVPEKTAQERIATILSLIDSKIDNNNAIDDELESMAKTLYDYWFHQFEFPNEEGKPYKSSRGKMVWNEELKREIPEGWSVKAIKEIEDNIVTGKTPSSKVDEYYNGNIPFITIGDIRGNMYVVSTEQTLSEKGANTQSKKYIPEDSLCVTCIATPGLVGFATKDSQTNQQINSIVPRNKFNCNYLYFAIKDYFAWSSGAKTGNVFANMNKEDFSNIQLLYSQNLVQKYYEKTKDIFKSIKNNLIENQELTSLRDFLLPLLMNGQIGFKEVDE